MSIARTIEEIMHGYKKRKPDWKKKKPGQSRGWDGEWRDNAPGARPGGKRDKARSRVDYDDENDDYDDDYEDDGR